MTSQELDLSRSFEAEVLHEFLIDDQETKDSQEDIINQLKEMSVSEQLFGKNLNIKPINQVLQTKEINKVNSFYCYFHSFFYYFYRKPSAILLILKIMFLMD